MASLNSSSSIKIHEHCHVSPPPTSPHSSIPLTAFDFFWLRFHPVERIFYYTFPSPDTDSSFFFHKLVPTLKTSLSHTLQHFLPLAGNIVWPSDSEIPIVQYNPGDDGVSLVIAESELDLKHVLDNSPNDAAVSHSFVPHLESSDSLASVISLQVTLFPNSGFSIGISTHHAVLDGKSSTMFIKAWASLCQQDQEPTCLVPELVPFFDREALKDQPTLDSLLESSSKLFTDDNNNARNLKILPFPPKLENSVRASFNLTRADLEKIKKRVLSKWDMVVIDEEESNNNSTLYPKPSTLSTFILTCSYVSVCTAKAIQGVESNKNKFAFAFTVDCRNRLLEPPIPTNYFGNCVWGHFIDTKPNNYTEEDGEVIVAKNIYNKIKMISDKGVLEGAKNVSSRFKSALREGVELMSIAGSTRFGVYGIDFGLGKPNKVEITSVDRSLTFGISDSRDEKGGVEVGLVLNKDVMKLFDTLFHEGLCID
ncbi:hypothetical protein TanjilG_23243 [Lupinus angustifolius]|uniref:Uncharacterized protein n=1 Tax=Lupinus angustifolius TaxID=3871 RepID=A0A1J7HSN9_LUPAN|nr:PREDICTED: malonyl-CoA:anthocyanidin 5-O-glucoside-6''-O-malonyltransferase-like [Lupinus angustifolius]OIW05417.1 hypothetical protein TanjilG_23243 [Lupinus angustifolius]